MDTKTLTHLSFDPDKKIIHISYLEEFRISTKAELGDFFDAIVSFLKTYKKYGRLYIVSDISNFIIEPELAEAYAGYVTKIYDKYLYEDGIARYGYQITRIMLKRAYIDFLRKNPNIFRTKKEAYDYIDSLIKENKTLDWVETNSSFMARPF